MLKTSEFVDYLKERGFNFVSGTPCSYLKPLINKIIDDKEVYFVDATNEGDAVAMASGAHVADCKGVAMFQNSGLGNAVNALTSLNFPLKIPLLIIVTHRGQPGGAPDEPQHELMGQITKKMLDTMQIKNETLPQNISKLKPTFDRIDKHFEKTNLPYALIMSKGSLEAYDLQTQGNTEDKKLNPLVQENYCLPYNGRPNRTAVLKTLLKHKQPKDVFIATTGKTGRELYELNDSDQNLYMVGSMGSASSFALGIALNAPKSRVFIIDGDGAALMRLGNLATCGVYGGKNLVHILIDNNAHDSTGGQSTISTEISFLKIAQGCAYPTVLGSDNLDNLNDWLDEINNGKIETPCFIHFKTQKGSPKNLGRPKIKPSKVKSRLMTKIKKDHDGA